MPHEALDKVTYTTSATSKNGRGGRVRSADGAVDLELGKPGSTSNPKANPETLFASGYSACFGSALAGVAGKEGIDANDAEVTVEVSLGETGTGFGLAAAITVSIPGVDQAKALELAEAAHQVCPYSKATRGNIDVTVSAA